MFAQFFSNQGQHSIQGRESQIPSKAITSELLYNLRMRSCSRANFSVNLVREIFSITERKESNVKGIKGKKKLNELKLQQVKSNAFSLYPLTSGEQQHTAWRLCERAIDESCRRLNRRERPDNNQVPH